MKHCSLRHTGYVFQICTIMFILAGQVREAPCADVRLEVKSIVGTPGTTNNEVAIVLANRNDTVSEMRFEICDVDNYLTLEDVLPTPRTQDLHALAFEELGSGCAAVALSFTNKNGIERGDGPVLILKCAVSPGAPLTEHRKITLENISIRNPEGTSLDVTPLSGAFIFIISQGSIKKVVPGRIAGNRMKSTIHPILVIGDSTKFNLSSRLNFNPRDEIECLWQAGFGNYLFAVIRVPAAPPLGFADINIFTDGGKALVNATDVIEVVVHQSSAQ